MGIKVGITYNVIFLSHYMTKFSNDDHTHMVLHIFGSKTCTDVTNI
jgi:hypothetical protein